MYQLDSLENEINKNLISKANSLVDKKLVFSTYQALNFTNFFLDGVKTGISLLDFVQQLVCRNAEVPDIYFILLDAAGIYPTLILSQNATAKE